MSEETIGDVIQRLKLNEHPEIVKLTQEIKELESVSCKEMDNLQYKIHCQKISDKYFQRRRTYERLAGWELTGI